MLKTSCLADSVLCQSNKLYGEQNRHSSNCGINKSSEIESGERHTKRASVQTREVFAGLGRLSVNFRAHFSQTLIEKIRSQTCPYMRTT